MESGLTRGIAANVSGFANLQFSFSTRQWVQKKKTPMTRKNGE
jgi:hypothetical protein